jgi:L-asparaginase II
VVSYRGEPGRAVLPRSAIKPIQSLPLLTTGAAAAAGLDDRHLALACASHTGEPAHVAIVSEWLDRLGLPVDALECGVHPPTDRRAADRLVAEDRRPDPRHNNCSGKHCGFLTVCAHLGIDPTGYVGPDHPLQRDHVTPALGARCEVDLAGEVPGVDGCGIPVWPLPLDHLARGWRRLADDHDGARLLDAMVAHPHLVAGTDRADTRLIGEGGGRIVVKSGAEGVVCGVDRVAGVAFALKVRDGAARAATVATEWLLAHSGALEPRPVVLRNWAGTVVGEVRVRD